MKSAKKPSMHKQPTSAKRKPPAPASPASETTAPVIPTQTVNLAAIGAALEDAGYDVTVYDHVEGRRDDVGGAWVVDVDASGKVTFRATHPLTTSQQTQLVLGEQTIPVTHQQNRVVMATTQVRGAADVPAVIGYLETLARGA